MRMFPASAIVLVLACVLRHASKVLLPLLYFSFLSTAASLGHRTYSYESRFCEHYFFTFFPFVSPSSTSFPRANVSIPIDCLQGGRRDRSHNTRDDHCRCVLLFNRASRRRRRGGLCVIVRIYFAIASTLLSRPVIASWTARRLIRCVRLNKLTIIPVFKPVLLGGLRLSPGN